MEVIDKLNEKLPDAVHTASFDKRHKMKQERLSRKFTTNLNEYWRCNYKLRKRRHNRL